MIRLCSLFPLVSTHNGGVSVYERDGNNLLNSGRSDLALEKFSDALEMEVNAKPTRKNASILQTVQKLLQVAVECSGNASSSNQSLNPAQWLLYTKAELALWRGDLSSSLALFCNPILLMTYKHVLPPFDFFLGNDFHGTLRNEANTFSHLTELPRRSLPEHATDIYTAQYFDFETRSGAEGMYPLNKIYHIRSVISSEDCKWVRCICYDSCSRCIS